MLFQKTKILNKWSGWKMVKMLHVYIYVYIYFQAETFGVNIIIIFKTE